MKSYILLALSQRTNQEGYLDHVLDDLVDKKIAIRGLGVKELYSRGLPISEIGIISEPRILFDESENPYILIISEHLPKVKEELRKRLVKPIGYVESDDLDDIISEVDRKIIHQMSQLKRDDKQSYSFCLN